MSKVKFEKSVYVGLGYASVSSAGVFVLECDLKFIDTYFLSSSSLSLSSSGTLEITQL